MNNALTIFALSDVGEIQRGTRLGDVIVDSGHIQSHDVIVVAQKLVSKSEGRLVEIDTTSAEAKRAVVLDQAVAVLRDAPHVLITQTSHGFVCANSGVDLSNAPDGYAVLLPKDPDRSANRIRDQIVARIGGPVGVIVSDTFGRPWRNGVTDVAIGSAGLVPIIDLRGSTDSNGRVMSATEICVVDELAGAAELVRRKADGSGVVVIRGVSTSWFGNGSVVQDVVRPANQDLFR
jgi:coenzyme F420-0:L-glutamate ligase/coenzyme F420-1:gamma-L-glutamate ligase